MKYDRDRLIKDFTALLEVPVLEKVLRNKIEELKIQYKDSIKEFKEISEVLEPGKTVSKIRKTEFEFLRRDMGWLPIIPGHDEPYKIVPKEVFDEIHDSAAERGTIIMNYPIKMPEGRFFEVTFEKHDENYYSGFIIEKRKKTIPVKKKTGNSSGNETLPTTKTELLKLLIKYLLVHEPFCNSILADFTIKWKPLLDNGLIVAGANNA